MHSTDSASGRTLVWALLALALSAAVPALVLVGLGRRGIDISGALVLILLGALALDAVGFTLAGILAVRAGRVPPLPGRPYPPATALVLAGPGSPSSEIRDTVTSLLRIPYLFPIQVIVVCGDDRAAGTARACIAAEGAPGQGEVLRVANPEPLSLLTAALPAVRGTFLGVFLPGQRPQASAFAHAWVWLSHGYEPLRGAMRADNEGASWSSRLAAVDRCGFDAPPPLLPAGRHLFGGGSASVFLTTALARALVARPPEGAPPYHGARDRRLSVREPGPSTLGATWRRWIDEETACLRARPSGAGPIFVYRTLWRPSLVWLTPAVAAAAGYRLAQIVPHPDTAWLLAVAILLSLYTVVPAILRSAFAYFLAGDDLRRHLTWFLAYAPAWIAGLGAVRTSAVRVALLRLALGSRPGASSAAAVEGGRTPEPAVPAALDAEEAPHQPDPGETPSPARAPLSPAAQRILAAADRLPAVVDSLLAALDDGVAEAARLSLRIQELERAVVARTQGETAVLARAANTIDPEALADLQQTVAALHDNPGSVLTLSALSRQTACLAHVVEAYGDLQRIRADGPG